MFDKMCFLVYAAFLAEEMKGYIVAKFCFCFLQVCGFDLKI